MFLFLILACVSLNAARVIQGDNPYLNTSFTFTIGPHAYEHSENAFFVGANVAVPGNTYAVAMSQNGQPFVALAPATVNLNGQPNSPSPLTGQQILFVTKLDQIVLPAVVPAGFPAQIFAPSTTTLSTTPTLNDANGVPSAGILALTAGVINSAIMGHYIIAAVENNAGAFGTAGSGIAAVMEYGEIPTLTTLNAVTGQTGGNLAFPLNTTTPAVFIGAPATSINNSIVDLHYDPKLGRFYIALSVTAAAGARSIVAGRIVNNVIRLDPIAPDAAFAGTNNKIVGTGTPAATVTAYKVRTLYTSTQLKYLIVAGGNGMARAVANTIYAMPLNGDGTLADVNSVPVDSFRPLYPNQFQSREFASAAMTPDALWSNTNVAAMVGGGPLPMPASSQITDLIALNDAVYVSITDAYNGATTPPSTPGVFYSQAIFDAFGRIQNWTAWTRAAGTDAQMDGVGVDPKRDTFWLIPFMASGDKTVLLTDWGTNQGDGLLGGSPSALPNGLTEQTLTQLPTLQGGVQYMYSFIQTTTGFGNQPQTPNNMISVLALLGRNTVMLVETGRNSTANLFQPNFGDFATGQQVFTNGTLAGFVSGSRMLVISGGALNTLGPLTSVEVSRAPLTGGNNGFFFFGGAGGLGVLSNPNGFGWATGSGEGLHAGFANLQPTMLIQTLGNYQFVRKLVADGTYLYVLTNTTLDRITIASIAAGGALSVLNLATPATMGLNPFASFSDFMVSGKMALLATSQGLYRVGNGGDVTSVSNTGAQSLNWTPVGIPESPGPVSRLQFITPSNMEPVFGSNTLMYVLCGNVSYNQARIARFAIGPVDASSVITNTTVQPLNDLFIEGVTSFLFEAGAYRNYMQADSVALFNSKTSDGFIGAQLWNYGMYQMADIYGARKNNGTVQLPSTLSGTIRRPVINVSGAWLLAGDFGMYANE